MRKKSATSLPNSTLQDLDDGRGALPVFSPAATDGALPPVETLSGVPVVPVEISVSPLQLAHLTAALAQAHLVQGSPKEKVAQAMDFLLWCGHLNEDFAWKYLAARYEKAEADVIGPLLAKYAGSVIIPVMEVISAAKLDYLKLERSELLEISIDVDFSRLTPELKAGAVLRFLTRRPPRGDVSGTWRTHNDCEAKGVQRHGRVGGKGRKRGSSRGHFMWPAEPPTAIGQSA